MMRRIDRELDLPSHVAKRIKARFEKLRREKEEYLEKIKKFENEYQTIKDSLETFSDAILQLNQKIEKIEKFLEKFGYE